MINKRTTRIVLILLIGVIFVFAAVFWVMRNGAALTEEEVIDLAMRRSETAQAIAEYPKHEISAKANLSCVPQCTLDPLCDPVDPAEIYNCSHEEKDWAVRIYARDPDTGRYFTIQKYIVDRHSATVEVYSASLLGN